MHRMSFVLLATTMALAAAASCDANTVCDPTAYQSLDGCCNNLALPLSGAADHSNQMRRLAPSAYPGDGSGDAIADRTPASVTPEVVYAGERTISNTVFDQDERDCSARALNEMVTFYGQFLNHDMHEAEQDALDTTVVTVPADDPFLVGDMVLTRTNTVPGTGTVDAPREQANDGVSTPLDLSVVYGLTEERLEALRDGIFLKTVFFKHGEFPPVGDDIGLPEFGTTLAFGDHRGNENPGLLNVHTLWVRNHNYWALRLRQESPTAGTDEELFQQARRMNIAEHQKFTTEDWLDALGVRLPEYTGYNDTTGPTPISEMVGGALRIGHTLLNDDFEFLDDNLELIGDPVNLKDSFFSPDLMTGGALAADETPDEVNGGVDAISRGLLSRCANAIDSKVVHGIRNFLFGEGSAGLDLVSINLRRGRDWGFSRYNAIREAVGLEPAASFADISNDPVVQDRLAAVYASVDDIDYWVGGLAENHVRRSSLGELFTAVFTAHFTSMRDNDRFWWEQDGMLDPNDADRDARLHRRVRETTFEDFLVRNTGIPRSQVPDNAFYVLGSPNADAGDGRGDGDDGRGDGSGGRGDGDGGRGDGDDGRGDGDDGRGDGNDGRGDNDNNDGQNGGNQDGSGGRNLR